MKKSLAILLLCLACAFCAIGVTACGRSGGSGKLVYEEENGTYVVSEYQKPNVYYSDLNTVTIPATYKGIPVTGIKAAAFKDAGDIGKITVESSEWTDQYFTIGEGAFSNCFNLKEISLPAGVCTIPDNAFYECRIKSVSFPNVQTVGKQAFYECRELETVSLPMATSIGEKAFYSCEKLKSAELANVAITNPMDPSQTVYATVNIGTGAFMYCKALESADLKYATSIGKEAFYYCESLKELTLSNYLRALGEKVFYECPVETINWAETEGAGSGYFTVENGCLLDHTRGYYSSEQKKTLSVLVIGGNSGTIPDGVGTIESGAFENRKGITEIVIPDSVEKIGSYAFYGCDNVESITLGKNVSEIENFAFYKLKKLSSITVSADNGHYYAENDSLIEVNEYDEKTLILASNSSVFTESSSFRRIGDYAFTSCPELKNLVIGNVYDIAYSAFYDCDLPALESIECYSAYGFKAMGNCLFQVMSDGLFRLRLGCKNSVIPQVFFTDDATTLFEIGSFAFSGATGLTEITLPEGITNIGACAFMGCTSLTEITIPASVLHIAYGVFDGCTSLASVTFEDPNGWIWSDGDGSTFDATNPTACAAEILSKMTDRGIDLTKNPEVK